MSGAARRVALVLSGGGARGAYEAGVLAEFFESVAPKLPGDFEFDIVSGTSVGAIHAAYVAATSHLDKSSRCRALLAAWSEMDVADVVHLGASDLLRIPMRALGVRPLRRDLAGGRAEAVGGLVDLAPLESLVAERIPWKELPANLAGPKPKALCVSCTEVRSGRITVFMDGPLASPLPWRSDPNATAATVKLTPHHVRASAAIPFLFPAVRIGERYFVDGGLRMNTPLSPALRLAATHVLVVALKHRTSRREEAAEEFSDDVITQPAFLLGKVLNALLLDQLDVEIGRMQVVNAILEEGEQVFGREFLPRINEAVRDRRGQGFRTVQTRVVRPSEDLGRIAARCYRERGGARAVGFLPSLIARATLRGVPEGEADLLSYLYFDRAYATELIELGRKDLRAMQNDVLEMLGAS
jgi:NTE family protein